MRAWLEATARVGVPNGPPMAEISRRAIGLIEQLRTEPLDSTVEGMRGDLDAPDVLHATIEVLEQNRFDASEVYVNDIGHAYELILRLTWPDEFGERDELLARLAFLAWDQSRLAGDFPTTRVWQARCTDHTLSQDHIRDFLAIPFGDRSAELNERYLANGPVLVAVCDRLEHSRNDCPVLVAREGAALYDWLETAANETNLQAELVQFLATSVAVSTLAAEHALRHREGAKVWSQRADHHVRASGSEHLAAVLDHLRLSALYWENAYSTALRSIDPLILRFENLEMDEAAVKSRFLKALLLKEVGQSDAALALLHQVRGQAREVGDPLVASLALANCAQIHGCQGRFAEALRLAREAFEEAEEADVQWAVAFAQGTAGELLRDHGDFDASVAAYASSVHSYESIGMDGLAAYTRILAAEVLLMAGQARDATSEILVALPTIEAHGLNQEAVAAIAILREAIYRRQADPEALRQLREQLQLMRQQGKL